MRKWLWAAAVLAVLLFGYVAAGPYLTIRAIGEAVRENDARALSKQVDFPLLRESLKRQLGDRLVREAGVDTQSSLLGAIGLRLAGGVIDAAVELAVTPVGLGALMEGRKVWRNVGESPVATTPPPTPDDDAARDPLHGAEHDYESPSRFTATIHDDDGRPLVFVLTRRGLHWRLSDIRLP